MAVVHLELPVEAISHTCRMCLAEDSASSMVAPCSCTGSQRYVHESCLRRWQSVLAEGRVNVGRGKTCSVCRVDFALTPLAVGTESTAESRLHRCWRTCTTAWLRELLALTSGCLLFSVLILVWIVLRGGPWSHPEPS